MPHKSTVLRFHLDLLLSFVTRIGSLLHIAPQKKCNTQSFPVVCDSPSPGTSWRNRENPAPLRAHVSATIGTEAVANLIKVSTCLHVRNFALRKMISSGKYIARVRVQSDIYDYLADLSVGFEETRRLLDLFKRERACDDGLQLSRSEPAGDECFCTL